MEGNTHQNTHSEELPNKFWCYKQVYDTLARTKTLFRKLFVQYQVCIKCVFKLYFFQYPKLYNDPQFYLEIIPRLCKEQSTENLMQAYNFTQCCLAETCWLCEEIFQKSYLNRTVEEIIELIKAKGHLNAKQFKLNIRVPNIISLKNVFLSRYVYEQIKRQGFCSPEQIKYIYNAIIVPLDVGKALDSKTVLKWLISHQLNQQTSMTSTAEESNDNLIISVEQDYNGQEVETSVMRKFAPLMMLQKKKQKKSHNKKIQLDFVNQQNIDYKCTSANANKILLLKHHEFIPIIQRILSKDQFFSIVLGIQMASEHPFDIKSLKAYSHISHKVSLSTHNLFLCGKYIKFSRYLSQTPWIVNGKKLTDGSLQQEIEDKIFHLFYPGKSKEEIQVKFHSGGREDIDVRMLKGGRPFVLEFVNPLRVIRDIKEIDILHLLPEQFHEKILSELQKYSQNLSKDMSEILHHSRRIVKLLQYLVNNDNQYVQIRQFQQTTETFISVDLKAAQTQKIKHYLCYIYSMQPLSQQDKILLEGMHKINLKQQTPIRVMHRRSLIIRDKEIYKLNLHLVSCHSAVLEVWASAGTYIKQFVHGDLGRTNPNIGSLLGKEVNILQLDVGSLKEGQWNEGDDEKMKIGKMEWMD